MNAAAIVEALGGRAGRCCCPVHQGKSASLAVRDGARGVVLHCHAGCDPRDVIAELDRRGLWAKHSGARSKVSVRSDTPAPRRDTSPAPLRWSTKAEQIWSRARPIAGTVVETYLRSRRCAVPADADLRCIPSYDGRDPVMVARVTDALTAAPLTLHFTRIAHDGRGKVDDGRPAKLLLAGHAKRGGVVRLQADADVTQGLALAEGIETALAVIGGGWRPAWATVDAGNLTDFPILFGIGELTIFADHDVAGLNAATSCAARWRDAGRRARIVMPPQRGEDWADVVAALAQGRAA